MCSNLIPCIILYVLLRPPHDSPDFSRKFRWDRPFQLDPDESCPEYVGCPHRLEHAEVIVIPRYLPKSILIFGPDKEAVPSQELLYYFWWQP
jgi:hypothetical protein